MRYKTKNKYIKIGFSRIKFRLTIGKNITI